MKVAKSTRYTLATTIIVVLLVVGSFIYKRLLSKKDIPFAQKRAMIIIFEDNSLSDFISNTTVGSSDDIYNRLYLRYLLKIDPSDYPNKSAKEIVDLYGEDLILQNTINAAKKYDKIVTLTDDDVTLETLKEHLLQLSSGGYITDIIINVHANKNFLAFGTKAVYSSDIINAFDGESINIGYVYQAACYGASMNDAWYTIGAKVVSGNKEINSLGILSPQKFLKYISEGCGYKYSVYKGTAYEYKKWKLIYSLLTKTYKNNLDDAYSNIVFLGNENYFVLNNSGCR